MKTAFRKLVSLLARLADRFVSLFDGFERLAPASLPPPKPRLSAAGRVTRFSVGDEVDCVAGPFAHFKRGRVLRVIDSHPVNPSGFAHCSGVSAHYILDVPDLNKFGVVIRYDWELAPSEPPVV